MCPHENIIFKTNITKNPLSCIKSKAVPNLYNSEDKPIVCTLLVQKCLYQQAGTKHAKQPACIAEDKVKDLRENIILNWTFPHPLMKREAWRGHNFTHLFFRSSKTRNIVGHCASLSVKIWKTDFQKNRLTSGRKIKKIKKLLTSEKRATAT